LVPAPLYLSADIRKVEQASASAQPPLMERAGAAAAVLAARIASTKSKDILVLAGPGDNGGDARICAERLKQMFFRVTVATRPEEIPADKPWGLVIDGLFGIGLARELTGDHAVMVDYANRQGCPVLALDVPSGLQADTGRVLGRAVRATHTLTFIGLKPGLLTLDGPDHCGEIAVDTLGLQVDKLVRPSSWVAHPGLFRDALRPRKRNFHKGLAGSLGIIGGAAGMTGAALLAGRAALRLGAGRVYVGLLKSEISVDFDAPELMLRHADDALGQDLDAVVVGPGLGTTEHAETLLGAVLASDLVCVLDADALNILSGSDDLRRACLRRGAEMLLTPHPAEAGRLLGMTVGEVQSNRVAAAQALSKRYNAHALLKGNGSVIAARDGHWFVNRSGHPGMASAGMGDVLSGILGALLAQRYTGESALVLGTHLHGSAADALAGSGVGPVGLAASEVIDRARQIWNGWLTEGSGERHEAG
jgi:ADP-dependent NAD(P)H-hydrate dehydratase / NAD(P)H-hydrate epimerase